mmetsp:Transcript_18386/g.71031  ORF Transcript_18386/g.71031 Transcript_18386/m.71031 type:complete len:287 (-) Transcript_18386:235-1095(-)
MLALRVVVHFVHCVTLVRRVPVVSAVLSASKLLHAVPAEVEAALDALHVVASAVLLDGNLAPGAGPCEGSHEALVQGGVLSLVELLPTNDHAAAAWPVVLAKAVEAKLQSAVALHHVVLLPAPLVQKNCILASRCRAPLAVDVVLHEAVGERPLVDVPTVLIVDQRHDRVLVHHHLALDVGVPSAAEQRLPFLDLEAEVLPPAVLAERMPAVQRNQVLVVEADRALLHSARPCTSLEGAGRQSSLAENAVRVLGEAGQHLVGVPLEGLKEYSYGRDGNVLQDAPHN